MDFQRQTNKRLYEEHVATLDRCVGVVDRPDDGGVGEFVVGHQPTSRFP